MTEFQQLVTHAVGVNLSRFILRQETAAICLVN